jgi:hypothetical protein
MSLQGITQFALTEHALFEMKRREINDDEIALTLAEPGQTEIVRPERAIYQRVFQLGDPPVPYLLRVVVDIDRRPPDVVTVYRTSKIAKYWRQDP